MYDRLRLRRALERATVILIIGLYLGCVMLTGLLVLMAGGYHG